MPLPLGNNIYFFRYGGLDKQANKKNGYDEMMKKAVSILLSAAILTVIATQATAVDLNVPRYHFTLNGETANTEILDFGDAYKMGGYYVPLTSFAKELGYTATVDTEKQTFKITGPYRTMSFNEDGDYSIVCTGLTFKNDESYSEWNIENSMWRHPLYPMTEFVKSIPESYIIFQNNEAYIVDYTMGEIFDAFFIQGHNSEDVLSPDFSYQTYVDSEYAQWNLATITDIDYDNRIVSLDDMIKGNVTAKLNDMALLDIGNLGYYKELTYNWQGYDQRNNYGFHSYREYSIYSLNIGDEVRVVYDGNNIKQLYKNDKSYFRRVHGTVVNAGWVYDDKIDLEPLPEPKFTDDEDWMDELLYEKSTFLQSDLHFILKLDDGSAVAISSLFNSGIYGDRGIILNKSKERITDLNYLKGKEVDIAVSVIDPEDDEYPMWDGMIDGLIVVVNEDSSPASVTAPALSPIQTISNTITTVSDDTPHNTKTASSNEVSVTLNGNGIVFDQPPVIIDGRTLVPMRAIFEAMGCDVKWDGETKTIEAFNADGDKIIEMQVGSENMWSAGNPSITLDVPPQIINDRTLVPVRAISESMGAEVNWHGDTRNVEIIYN